MLAILDGLTPWLDAVKGQYGTIGLFTAAQHAFITFGLLGGAGSWLIGASPRPPRNPHGHPPSSNSSPAAKSHLVGYLQMRPSAGTSPSLA